MKRARGARPGRRAVLFVLVLLIGGAAVLLFQGGDSPVAPPPRVDDANAPAAREAAAPSPPTEAPSERAALPTDRARLLFAFSRRGRPAAGIEVELQRVEEPQERTPAEGGNGTHADDEPALLGAAPVQSRRTDEEGRIDWLVDPGTYRWRCDAPGCLPTPLPSGDELGGPVTGMWSGPIRLAAGEEKRIAVDVAASVVRGFVMLPSGRPAAHARLTLAHGLVEERDGERREYFPDERSGETGDDGSFVFEWVLPSSPDERQEPPWTRKLLWIEYREPGHVWFGLRVFLLAANQDLDLGTIVLQSEPAARLRVELVDPQGMPVSPSDVLADGAQGLFEANLTDLNRRRPGSLETNVFTVFPIRLGEEVTVHGLFEDEYSFSVVPEGGEFPLRPRVLFLDDWTSDVTFWVPQAAPAVLRFVVEPSPREAILDIVAPEGAPEFLRVLWSLPDLSRRMERSYGGWCFVGRNAQTGLYSQGFLLPRTRVDFAATSNRYDDVGETSVYGELSIDAVQTGSVLLRAGEGGTVTGVARNRFGTPCADSTVLLRDPRVPDRWLYGAPTDEQGRFVLRGIPPKGFLLDVAGRRIPIGARDAVVREVCAQPPADG